MNRAVVSLVLMVLFLVLVSPLNFGTVKAQAAPYRRFGIVFHIRHATTNIPEVLKISSVRGAKMIAKAYIPTAGSKGVCTAYDKPKPATADTIKHTSKPVVGLLLPKRPVGVSMVARRALVCGNKFVRGP